MTKALQALSSTPDAAAIESVVVQGDLSKLTPAQRVSYYQAVCASLKINPLTRPFEYITLNGKLTLYARKDCTDQLRRAHNISIDKPDITFQDEWIVVSVSARDDKGRTDADVGVVNKKDMRGDFGNALMKCVTKAKRRVTLSICGLGMTDESEIDSIPDATPVAVDHATGEVIDLPTPRTAPPNDPQTATPPANDSGRTISPAQQKRLFAIARDSGWSHEEIAGFLHRRYGIDHSNQVRVADYDAIIDRLKAGLDGLGVSDEDAAETMAEPGNAIL